MRRVSRVIISMFFFLLVVGCQEKTTTLYGEWVVTEGTVLFEKGDTLLFNKEGGIQLNGWSSTYSWTNEESFTVLADPDQHIWTYSITGNTLSLRSEKDYVEATKVTGTD
ncbi:hypothetical protein [Pontibacillus halophilus]|nr:hypothetical protein [Pontibacillus halophilus]